jgi:aldehyde:ferredoxin oxidoreductase
VLAENYLAAARKFGKGSEDYFIHTKGIPVNYFELREFKGLALAGAVSAKGDFMNISPLLDMMGPMVEAYEGEAREQMQKFVDDLAMQVAGNTKSTIPTEYEGKAASLRYYVNVVSLADSLGLCRWQGPQTLMPMIPERLAELYSAGKGVEMTAEKLMEAAQRGNTVERAFAAREGLTRAEDTLPKRFFEEPIPEGPFKGEKVDRAKLEEMKTEYYALEGWDPTTGIPTQETLERLGLNDVAESLKKETKADEAKGKAKGKNMK